MSMTSTTTGLPDRYRPLDQVGPDEPTSTGVIQCWRAKDRVLNRDVAIRVHTPAGPAAHAWISRALTAGGLATPALAMVYDASEGIGGGPGGEPVPGGAAYVVNEWIDGETLGTRLARGPMPDREVRTVLRRLAEGVAEAHRVGLPVGGLTPDNVVLRPNGLVGLRAVPAATGTIDGDIAALGALLEACLTGLDPSRPGVRRLTGPPDLVALVRRARSTEPGQGLSSVAAMASLLGERSRPGPMSAAARAEETDSGWLRRLRDRRPDQVSDHPDGGAPLNTVAVDGDAVPLDRQTMPPVPPVRPVTGTPVAPGALGGDTVTAGSVAPSGGAYAGSLPTGPRTGHDDDSLHVLDDDPGYEEEDGAKRHKLVVAGLSLLALLVVVALAWWLGKGVISVADGVDETPGSTPSASAPAEEPDPAAGGGPTAGAALPIAGGDVFDPQGDGDPDNPGDVELAFDGDAGTAWSTYEYRGSPAFGNLKDGVGLLLDLGSAQDVAAVTVTGSPGATAEIRTGDSADGDIDSFGVAATGELGDGTEFAFDAPESTRYVLVWITGLVPSEGGFSAGVAEVAVQAVG
ncbi:MAG: Pseudokinase domain in MviN [uncultured Blastococcus sp.]|uniref:Pseudokinase domain in MviN n=1 Tax=uncultured Blastococcus sp. TaxID=217144 RepID=A0A6J4HAR1_9ACTN|nr:MAG: Pseudokinase domain in MviN [uncultured Blastococcus sp.]